MLSVLIRFRLNLLNLILALIWLERQTDQNHNKVIYQIVTYIRRYIWMRSFAGVLTPASVITLPPVRVTEYCDERVCVFFCLSVCPRICLLNYTPDLHQIFCTYLWPWLGPPLAALRCVMYIRFYGLRHVCALCPGEYTIRYDTIRDAILTCARKPT